MFSNSYLVMNTAVSNVSCRILFTVVSAYFVAVFQMFVAAAMRRNSELKLGLLYHLTWELLSHKPMYVFVVAVTRQLASEL